MVEQDYMMRLVQQIARMLAKILFNIDSETISEDLEGRIDKTDTLERLLAMIEEGKINEAENQLFDLLDEGCPQCTEIALLFYSHLNEKTDDFLKENDYSREEVKDGIAGIAERVGLSELVSTSFMDA